MKNVLIVLSIILLFTLIACNPRNNTLTTTNTTTISHNYFAELPQFTFRIISDDPFSLNYTTYSLSPASIQARYIKQAVVPAAKGKTSAEIAYIFSLNTGTQVSFIFPPRIADNISLSADEVYDLAFQIHQGWPTVYGLMISKENTLEFAGVSDWSVNSSNIKITQFLPYQVTQTRILTDNYIIGEKDDFFVKKTNTEISFSFNGKSATLHQGQSSILDGYNIKLLIARYIQYKSGWYDIAQNGISYIIIRK